MKRTLKFLIKKLIYGALGGVLFLSFVVGYVLFTWQMPSVHELKNYTPPTITRFYASDHKIFAEFSKEKRIFVPYEQMPPELIRIFVTIEDKHFFSHKGIDYWGILRAALKNIRNISAHREARMGGSTITQQVAKNFFLSHNQTFARKIKEIILALKIEKLYTKQKILELYLNEIYLGGGRYGVESAANYYFNKSLHQLTLGEMAYLAILPKAPNYYNYFHDPERAIQRRNWALIRLYEEGAITERQARAAQREPLEKKQTETDIVHAAFFSEMLRKDILKKYGPDLLYKAGLRIQTTLDTQLQNIATDTLRAGLVKEDQKLGWRGPLGQISTQNWEKHLSAFSFPKGISPYQGAVVLEVMDQQVKIGLSDGTLGIIPYAFLKWARKHIYEKGMLFPELGPSISHPKEVLSEGDVILVKTHKKGIYTLAQIPEVDGALIALDPKTGNILALVGGYSFERSQFNRAIQSLRQPGSSFKTFLFLAALEEGYTLESLISDEAIEIKLPSGQVWRPQNITEKAYGLIPLKQALYRSMNLAPIWLAQQIGMDPIKKIARRFEVHPNLPLEIVTVLGTAETTLLRMVSAYGTIANYGQKVTPRWIEAIYDRRGQIIYEAPHIQSQQVTSPKHAYAIIQALQAAVEEGASHQGRVHGYAIAGKTGTTNNYFDAWFLGFSPDLVVGVFVGFDHPKSLGKHRTGGAVAGPIFKAFMEKALKNTHPKRFSPPKNTETQWVDDVLDTLDATDTAGFGHIMPTSIF